MPNVYKLSLQLSSTIRIVDLTDYYPLIARVIASLSSQNNRARDNVYRTAKIALKKQLRLLSSVNHKDIIKEFSDLSIAIARVEQECLRQESSYPAVSRLITKLDEEAVILPSHSTQLDQISSSTLLNLQNHESVANGLSAESSPGRIGSSATLLVANLSEAFLPFLRNIALARLMPPSQFGLAISLSIVLGMVEVLTDFGLPIFAVRRDTPAPAADTMSTLQTLTLIRSTVLAIVLVSISPWVAALFGAPHSGWTYALLGPIALLRGLENFGTKEAMRSFVFWREAVALGSAQVVWVIVTVVMAALTHTFECMIWGMLAGTATMLVMTHVLSPRRFGLGWNRIARADATRFGRPLIINGFAVALSMSDRLLVGSSIGPSVLAMYNVGYGTAMLPRSVLTKFLTNAFLPLFVRERDHPTDDFRLYDVWAWCLSLLGFFYGLVLTFVGDRIIGLVFTPQYQPSRLFMSIAGVSVCVKFLMLLPVPAAYASGHTKVITLGSSLSASVVIPGALVLLQRHDVNLFLAVMTTAEALGLLFFARITLKRQAFDWEKTWTVILVPVSVLIALSVFAFTFTDISFPLWVVSGTGVFLAGMVFYIFLIFRFAIDFRSIIR